MAIFRIHPDRLHYRLFTISTDEIIDKLGEDYPFHIDPSPKAYASVWKPLFIDFYDSTETGTVVAMPDLTVDGGRMYLSEKAYKLLKDLLEPCGEFLPVTTQGGAGYVFNVLALADAVDGIDGALSTKNAYGDLQSLAFREDRLKGITVFRTGFDGYMGVFCGGEFKDRVERSGLKGIVFSLDLANIFPPDSTAHGFTAQ